MLFISIAQCLITKLCIKTYDHTWLDCCFIRSSISPLTYAHARKHARTHANTYKYKDTHMNVFSK